MLIQNFPEKYREVRQLEKKEHLPAYSAENKVFGITHQEAGAYVLGLWMLPSNIIDTLLFHHQVLLVEEPKLSVLTFVIAANIMVREENTEHNTDRLEFQEYLSVLKAELNLEQWEADYRR